MPDARVVTMEEDSVGEWTNWSGNLRFTPDRIAHPESEEDLQALVRRCRDDGRQLRVVGRGHSWTPVVETDDVLVSLDRLTGLVDTDRAATTATIRGGATLEEINPELHKRRLAFPNLGDVSMQTVAGAFATGTHGTGTAFENLAGTLIGGRMVTGTGEVREFGPADTSVLRAARVSLGALGILTELELDLIPTYKLERREYCTRFADAWDHVDDLIADNRNFDFYWYPRSDEVKLRLLNPPGGGTDDGALEYATLVEKDTDWWHQAIPAHNDIGREFEEMEYAVPRDRWRECFLAVRERVRSEWRADVGWRLLVRTVADDDTYLSADHGRETVTIGVLQNAQLEFWDYFRDLESIFREYEGRPHWGKRHTLREPTLRELYPDWDRFQSIRRETDPDGVFATEYMTELLG